jgi:hypothetical protein
MDWYCSPDFNPQERVSQEIKKPLKGKVFNNLDEIEALTKNELERMWKDPGLVKSWTAWGWIT